MAIVAVPQLSDNYAYLVIDDASKQSGVAPHRGTSARVRSQDSSSEFAESGAKSTTER